MGKNRWSGIALIACFALLFLAGNFYYPRWQKEKTEATLSWDVAGYYLYLPAVIIYGDPAQLEFMDNIIEEYYPAPEMNQAFRHESGNYIMKYSSGLAISYLPGFMIAHLYAHFSKYPADGFSKPYQFGISQWSLLIALMGLWILRRFLLYYFEDVSVAVTLVAIVFGTNYLSYASTNGAMTHNYLFTIYAFLLLTTMRFYKKPTSKGAIAIGLLSGLATLIRPTEMISVLIPLLWGLQFPLRHFLNEKFSFFKQHFRKIILAVICFIMVGSIQLLYWKIMSGDWLVYSYEDQGFNWLKPRFWKGLFSYRAGWLMYSPIMIFALIGFYFLRKKLELFSWTLLFTAIFMYITFSWENWWYGGSLGQRALVQYYPIFAMPFAALVSWVKMKKWRKTIFYLLAFVFTLHSIWWFHQSHKGGLFVPWQMNKAYYKAILGKFSVDDDVIKLLDTNERIRAIPKDTRLIYFNDFESEEFPKCELEVIDGTQSPCLSQTTEKIPLLHSPVVRMEGENYARVSADFRIGQKEWVVWNQTQFMLQFRKDESVIKEKYIKIQRLMNPGETKRIDFLTALPEETFDEIGIQFKNPGSPFPVAIDNVKLEFY